MKNTTRIGIVLCITLVYFIAEITVGFKTKSLALIADAFHYFNDVVAYTIAFTAAYLQDRGKHTPMFTFAFHRAGLVGAFFNGVFLLALALSIFLQSLERFVHIEVVEKPFLVLVIGCVGLVLNSISALIIHEHSHERGQLPQIIALKDEPSSVSDSEDNIHANHNHIIDPLVVTPEHNLGLLGVLIHVLGDALNNIGVIIAAVIMWKVELQNPNRFYADPAASVFISLIIFFGSVPLTLRSARILLEGTPRHLDLAKVKEDLLTAPKVLSVHDFHVWHLSQSIIMASLHVCVPMGTSLEEWEEIQEMLLHCLGAYGIGHVTISPEIQRPEVGSVPDRSLARVGGCKRLSFQDEFGCAVGELKKKLDELA